MDARGLIYELTDEQREAMLKGEPLKMDEEAKAEFKRLSEDVARLDGYLKGRADSDRPNRERPNSDLTRRSTSE